MKHRHGNILAVLHYFTIIIERNALDNLEYLEHLEKYTKKRERPKLLRVALLGGGYLLSHFRSTIGVVRLNFSVRNGKRWDPHAMTT